LQQLFGLVQTHPPSMALLESLFPFSFSLLFPNEGKMIILNFNTQPPPDVGKLPSHDSSLQQQVPHGVHEYDVECDQSDFERCMVPRIQRPDVTIACEGLRDGHVWHDIYGTILLLQRGATSTILLRGTAIHNGRWAAWKGLLSGIHNSAGVHPIAVDRGFLVPAHNRPGISKANMRIKRDHEPAIITEMGRSMLLWLAQTARAQAEK
jgi:hypothetical protein